MNVERRSSAKGAKKREEITGPRMTLMVANNGESALALIRAICGSEVLPSRSFASFADKERFSE
jgi:hypothetical protein